MSWRLALSCLAAASAVAASAQPGLARCGDALFNSGEECDDGDLGSFLVAFAFDADIGPLAGLASIPEHLPSGQTRWLVGDPTRERVIALTETGALNGVFASLPDDGVRDVLVDDNGIAYVATEANQRVARFLVGNGQSLGAFPLGGGLVEPYGLAVSGSFLYVASLGPDEPIVRIAISSGALIGPFGGARGERALAFDSDGVLYTGRGVTIHRYGVAGNDLGRFADGTLELGSNGRFNSLAFADDGTLYALGQTAGGTASLLRYRRDGSKIGGGGQSGLLPTFVAIHGTTIATSMRSGALQGVGTFVRGNSDLAADACRLNCRAPFCSDGVQDSGEGCDDGNIRAGDGCDGECRLEGCPDCPDTCGDGVLDQGEGCDDGDEHRDDGCDPDCAVEPGWSCMRQDGTEVCSAVRCGDSLRAGDEECDDGNGATGDGCDQCRLEAGWVCLGADGCRRTCGNGMVDEGENCDDGTTSGGDGCDPSCRIEPGWSCPQSGGACVAARCGDGVAAGIEECDDENESSGDGCDASCVVEIGWVCDRDGCRQTCGDGAVDAGEECDLGDLEDGDGCDGWCRTELGWFCDSIACTPICGDLLLVGDEGCDDLNELPGDGCDGCQLESGWVCQQADGEVAECADTCGNGEIDPLEACDDGGYDLGDGCDANCGIETGWACGFGGCSEICGDELVVGEEACDDGNAVGFDGCDRCTREPGWVCDADGCRQTCGNGAVEVAEPCDDGDLQNGDGCDELCDVEPGWVCEGSPSECDAAACGDGILAGFEGCDDGGLELGDGCDGACLAEVGWTCDATGCEPICGDARWLGDEGCDDGNSLAGDGCTACGIESGWTCNNIRGARSECRPEEVCGDGELGGSEPCEDGNLESGDGCTAECEIEFGWTCGPDLDDGAPGCVELDDDADGLSNLRELELGTLVDDVDSDDDGLEDGDEVSLGTSPLDGDSDGDGLSDGFEVRRDLDPLERDSDGDGFEDAVDLCPTVPDPDQRDRDRDGIGAACDNYDVPIGVATGGDCSGGAAGSLGLLLALLVTRWRRRSG